MGNFARRTGRAAALAGVLFIGVAGIAYATGSVGSGTITACLKKNNGQLRLVSTAGECTSRGCEAPWTNTDAQNFGLPVTRGLRHNPPGRA